MEVKHNFEFIWGGGEGGGRFSCLWVCWGDFAAMIYMLITDLHHEDT